MATFDEMEMKRQQMIGAFHSVAAAMQQCAGAVNEYLAAVNLPPMNPASTWTPNGNTGASNAFPSTLAGAQAQAQAPIGVGVGVGAGANTSNNNQQGNKGMMDPFHYTNLGGHQHQLQSQQQQQRQQQQQQQQMQNQSGLHTQAQNGGVNPTALAIAALNASNAQAMAAAPPAQVQAQTPDNAPKKRGRKPTKEKKYKDPNAPKRPPSAYLLFQNEVMQQIRQTNPDMQYKEVLTNIANRWKQLTPEEKKHYDDAYQYAHTSFKHEEDLYAKSLAAAANGPIDPALNGMVQQEYDDSDDSEDDVDGMTRTPAQPAQAQQQQPRASMGSTSFNGMAADSATFGAPMQQQQAVQGQVQGEGKKKKAAGGDDGEKKKKKKKTAE